MSTSKQAKVLCFSNHKGGVGKTCSACNVAAGFAKKKKKTLVIDLDPQANLSISLGASDTSENSIYEALTSQISIEDAIHPINDYLDIVPASLDLAGAEVELSSEPGREVILREMLSGLRDKYDYIVIDCAPSLGILTTNALTAADEVFIPVQSQYLALQGISKLMDVIYIVQKRLNKGLMVGGVFITQFDSRKVLDKEIAKAIETHFASSILKTKIRDNVTLAEAPGSGKDIFHYQPKSNGAADYQALCSEIMTRHKKKKKKVSHV